MLAKSLPLTNRHRAHTCLAAGADIPDSLTARVQLDACNEQWACMMSAEFRQLCADNKITIIKGNPSRTSVEQAADTMAGHRTMKANAKVPHDDTPSSKRMKIRIEQYIAREAAINMNPLHKKAVVTFMSHVPAFFGRSFSEAQIIRGHVLSGNLDKETGEPSYDGMRRTRKKHYTQEDDDAIDSVLEEAVREALTTGTVSEVLYDQDQTPEDLESTGKAHRRDNDFAHEQRHRSKILFHPRQVAMREEHAALQQQARTDKHVKEQAARDSLLKTATVCEDKVIAILKPATLPTSQAERDTIMATASTAEFDKVKPMSALLAYAAVRRFTTSKPEAAGWKGLKKAGCVTQAHAMRGKPIMLKQANIPVVQRQPKHTVPVRVVDTGRSGCRSATVLLADPDWVAAAKSSMLGVTLPDNVPAEAASSAETLCKIVHARLDRHIERRLIDKRMRESWVWREARDKIPALCAVAVLSGHVLPDVKGAPAEGSLLMYPNGQFTNITKGSTAEDWEGCYFHRDPNGNVVRAGKAVRMGGFAARAKEHFKCAQLKEPKDRENAFYAKYPSRLAGMPPPTGGCHFEQLTHCVGMAFDRGDDAAIKQLCNAKGGVFHWGEVELAKIREANIKGTHTLRDKQLHFVGFAFELFYDLLLSPRHNISRAPGYEGPLGVHARKRTSTEATPDPVAAEGEGTSAEGGAGTAVAAEATEEEGPRRGSRKRSRKQR